MMLFDRGGNVCDSKASVALRPLRCAREHPGPSLVEPGRSWCRTTAGGAHLPVLHPCLPGRSCSPRPRSCNGEHHE